MCQRAHLACGDVDALVEQRRSDRFPLPVAEEALESDEDHHVIADVAAGQQMLGEGVGPLRHQDTRGVTPARGAGAYGLPSLELSVGQGLAVSGPGLLDEPPLPLARRADALLLVGRKARAGSAQ